MTPKVVPDGPDLPLIPITSHSRKGAEWLIAQINATSMQINVPWMIFMVTSSLFDFEYKQCVLKTWEDKNILKRLTCPCLAEYDQKSKFDGILDL